MTKRKFSQGIHVRRATLADKRAYLSLEKEIVDFHKRLDPLNKTGRQVAQHIEKEFHKSITKRNMALFMVESAGKPVGIMMCTIMKASPFGLIDRVGLIDAAYVKEKYRNQLLGTKMTEAACAWFLQRKLKYSTVNVHARNDLGNRFWKKMGYQLATYRYMKKIA